MSNVSEYVTQLSNSDLRKELLKVGITPSPLTPTTRRIFQRKLLAKLKLSENVSFESTSSASNQSPPSADGHENSKVPPLNASVDDAKLQLSMCKQTDCNENSVCMKNNVSTYYVVVIPSESKTVTTSIFDNKTEAWKLLQSHKDARFQQFQSISAAEEFAHHEITSPKEFKTLITVEKPHKFPSPKQTELTELMHVIENNDIERFHELVWTNPRFLIGAADTPVPLKPSMRYNALHITARSNHLSMMKKIFSTLHDPTFHALMYDDEVSGEGRVGYIVDLYVNTPERGRFDTPLHIAAGFGFTDIVAELISHPLCDKTAKNKYGETPSQVVCSRAPSSSARDEILFLLDDHYYLPLIRCHDNSHPPTVGRPMSSAASPNVEKQNSDPTQPEKMVSALAGPMTHEEARMLHHRWSTPNRRREKGCRLAAIRLTDLDRGEERVGRQIARESGLQWLEYWDFLDNYADFSTDEGMSQLEAYLHQREESESSHVDSLASSMGDSVDEISLQMAQLSVENIKKTRNGDSMGDLLESPLKPSRSASYSLNSAKKNLLLRALKCQHRSPPAKNPQMSAADPLLPSTPCISAHSGRDSPVNTSHKRHTNVFIMGSHPSKLDRDVLLAIVHPVDRTRYPLIFKWAHNVSSFPEEDQLRWKTPRKKRPDLHCSTQSSSSSPLPRSPTNLPSRVSLIFTGD